MTKTEFQGQFVRLCKGFKYEATDEQANAWFRRIGHVALSVWSEGVTSLLCAKYFPKLDEVLAVIENEAEAQRRAAVAKDQRPAKRLYRLVESGEVSTALSPALFQAIKAVCGRDQARKMRATLEAREDRGEPIRRREMARLIANEAELTRTLTELLPTLEPANLDQFMASHGAAAAS